MVRDIIRGILSEHQSKPLTKKLIEGLVIRITAAIQMMRSADPAPDINIDSVSKQVMPVSTPESGLPNSIQCKVETLEGTRGNKAFISTPETPEVKKTPMPDKVKKKPVAAIVALPIGAMGEGSFGGKRVAEDVGAFAIKHNE